MSVDYLLQERARGCLVGLAVGDAVGTTVEFASRGSFPPVQDMTGGGPFGLEPGEWTDDTSMALCLAESLIERGGSDAADQMKRYCRWWRDGHLSVTGRCFDIGTTVRHALATFERTGNPFSGSTDPQSAGNGSIMRLAPVPIFFGAAFAKLREAARESSRTTHGALECLDACQVLAVLLQRLMCGAGKEEALRAMGEEQVESAKVREIIGGSYRTKEEPQIGSSGYVIHTLEASLWSFQRTDNFRDAILTAVNLGGDADTTGAVCGQIAGACYGIEAIPGEWLQRLKQKELILGLADALLAGSSGGCES